MGTLCRLIIPLRCNVASLKTKRGRKVSSSMFWSILSQSSTRYRLSFGRRACTSCRRYSLNSKRRLNTRQTVGSGIPSSVLALQVDVPGLRLKLSWIRLTFSSDTRGRPELLSLHRQPFKLVIPATNALLRWRLNVATKTKRTMHSSPRRSFNELTNAKNLVLRSSHFALNWLLCARRAL